MNFYLKGRMKMGKKFKPEKVNIDSAQNNENKDIIKTDNKNMDRRQLEFKRRYYDLKTEKPISIEEIEKRIKLNCMKMDRLTIEMIMDLAFIHRNWSSFYNRKDSFKNYLKNNMPLSRSYFYEILKILEMINIYLKKKESDNRTLLTISNIFEKTSVFKLKLISYVKDENQKYDTLEKIITGNDISINEIKQINKKTIKKINRMNSMEHGVVIANYKIKEKQGKFLLHINGNKKPITILILSKEVRELIKTEKDYNKFKTFIKKNIIKFITQQDVDKQTNK